MAMSKGKRHEIKYRIHKFDYLTYRERLAKVLQEDHSINLEGYEVLSIYFDDPYNNAYLEKIRGDAFRAKYRIRYYSNDLSVIKLEKKEKWESMTVKTSTTISKEQMEAILAEDYNSIAESEDVLLRTFYMDAKGRGLKPKSVIRYQRNAFLHPVGELRITFDTDIKCAVFEKEMTMKKLIYTKVLEHDEVIMEIKFNGMIPTFVGDMIQAAKAMSSSSSKYVYSRADNYNY